MDIPFRCIQSQICCKKLKVATGLLFIQFDFIKTMLYNTSNILNLSYNALVVVFVVGMMPGNGHSP